MSHGKNKRKAAMRRKQERRRYLFRLMLPPNFWADDLWAKLTHLFSKYRHAYHNAGELPITTVLMQEEIDRLNAHVRATARPHPPFPDFKVNEDGVLVFDSSPIDAMFPKKEVSLLPEPGHLQAAESGQHNEHEGEETHASG